LLGPAGPGSSGRPAGPRGAMALESRTSSGDSVSSRIATRARGLRLPPRVVRGADRVLIRPVLGPRVPVGLQRAVIEAALSTPVPAGTHVTRSVLGGVAGERVEHRGADPSLRILYLHGGGYALGSARSHRALAAHVSRAVRAPVHAISYRRAPEHPFPAGLDDALAAYESLLRAARSVAVAGDSAGGGLAVALALRARDRELPLPAVLLLFSPWTDLTLSGTSVTGVGSRDPLLRADWLRATAGWYRGGHDAALPELSPLNAELSGLPPIVMQSAGDDLLRSDADRLAERARAAGVRVDHEHFDDLWHDFQLHVGLLRDSDEAVERAGRAVRALVGGTDTVGALPLHE
jgi:epsilon-lactone hydrolase